MEVSSTLDKPFLFMFLENIHPTMDVPLGLGGHLCQPGHTAFGGILGSIIFKPWSSPRLLEVEQIDDQHDQLQTKMIRWLRLDQQNLEDSLRDPSAQPDSSKPQATYNRIIIQKQGAK